MRMFLALTFLILASCVVVQARGQPPYAAYMDGNTLHEDLRGDNVIKHASARGYILGVHDSLAHKETFCMPDTVTKGQVQDVVAKWLAENPARRDTHGAVVVTWALLNAWPCPEKPKPAPKPEKPGAGKQGS